MSRGKSPDPPRKGEPRKPERTDDTTNHSPKGTPTEQRHDTEVAGGEIEHDEPLTTKHPPPMGGDHA